jgi:hypothetical protein
VVLEGAMNDNADVAEFAKTYGPNIPVGTVDRISGGANMQIPPMERAFVPFMMFIDRNGMIQSQYTGGDAFLSDEGAQEKNIRAEVMKLLSAAPAKAAGKKK